MMRTRGKELMDDNVEAGGHGRVSSALSDYEESSSHSLVENGVWQMPQKQLDYVTSLRNVLH